MRKRIINIVLAISLVITSSGWALTHNSNNLLLKKIQEQKVDFDKQSTEIANLENVIVQKDNDLNAKNMVIEKQKLQVNKQNKELLDLKKKNEELKKENKNLKQNENLKQNKKEGSGVGGRKVNVEMTAYIAKCSEGCTGITATGINVSNTTTYQGHRIIATDPDVIPLYSIVEIKTGSSSFTAIALDTGGAINGNIVDFLVGSTSEARQFGRQQATITVIREGR